MKWIVSMLIMLGSYSLCAQDTSLESSIKPYLYKPNSSHLFRPLLTAETLGKQADKNIFVVLKKTSHAHIEPIFCRIEWKLGKSTGKNVLFRLGSADYVDYLEGKRRKFTPN